MVSAVCLSIYSFEIMVSVFPSMRNEKHFVPVIFGHGDEISGIGRQ